MRTFQLAPVLRFTAALTGASLLLAGCASVPSQEMSDARLAVDAARQADAVRLAPAAMSRADAALDDATRALRAGNYDGARQHAAASRSEAILARRLAGVIAEVQAAVDAARSAQRPWQGASELLARAQETSRAGDTERALAIARRARALLP